MANSIDTLYSNPAGLSLLFADEIQMGYIPYALDINVGFINYVKNINPLKGSGFGVGVIYLYSGDFVQRTETGGSGTTFSYNDFMICAGYGIMFNNLFRAGINLKFIYEQVLDYRRYGFGVDMGIIYAPLIKSRIRRITMSKFQRAILPDRIGLVLKNIGYGTGFIRNGEILPLSFSLGITYFYFKNKLSLSIEYAQPLETYGSISAGLEYNLLKIIFLRLGYEFFLENRADSVWNGVTAGLGINYRGIKGDYAIKYNSDIGFLHYAAVSYQF